MARAKEVTYWVGHDPEHGWVPHIRISFLDRDHYVRHELHPEETQAKAQRRARIAAQREAERRSGLGYGVSARPAIREEILTW